MEGKRKIFDSFFRSIRKDGRRLLDEEYASVAAAIFNIAWKEINGEQDNSDYESDCSDDDSGEKFDSKLEKAVIYVEHVAELSKISTEAKNKFLLGFNEFSLNSLEGIQGLKDLSTVLKSTEGAPPVPDDSLCMKVCAAIKSVQVAPYASSCKKWFVTGYKKVRSLGCFIPSIPIETAVDVMEVDEESFCAITYRRDPSKPLETADDAEVDKIHMEKGEESSSNIRFRGNSLETADDAEVDKNPVEKGEESSSGKSLVIETADDAWLVEIHIKRAKENFSAMTDWFLSFEKLEKEMSSLFYRNVSKEMVQEVQIFSEEQGNLSDDAIQGKFITVVRHCIGQMVKHSKITKEYGNELAPAVMTYLIVVCLMSDENRIALGCSSINQRMCFDLMTVLNHRALEDQLIDGLAAKGMSSVIATMSICETLTWYGNVIKLLSSIATSKSSDSEHSEQNIRDVAEKLEKIVGIIERAHNETKTFSSKTNATQQKAILVRQTPKGVGHADVKMAVKPYVPEEAWDRIEVLKIPTIENNWLVKVPENHALILLQQTKINIGGKDCTVFQ